MIKDRRVFFRKGLSGLYTPVYDALSALLPDAWQPYQGYRSLEEQDKLYAQGRTTPGEIVTLARAGLSPHNYGCASDWTIFTDGKPEWLKAKDPRWEEYEQACEKAGARWGGSFSFQDRPHNELPIRVRWREVNAILRAQGMDLARAFISQSRE